jgi:hypothetical protein
MEPQSTRRYLSLCGYSFVESCGNWSSWNENMTHPKLKDSPPLGVGL